MKKEFYFLIISIGTILLSNTACTKDNAGPVPTPTPVCGYAFGNNADNDTLGWAGGYLFASSFTLSAGENISSLAVKLGAATNYIAGVYSDNSGVPADIMTQTGVVSGISGWNTAVVQTAGLIKGGTYWLVVVTENVGVRLNPGTGAGKSANISWSEVSAGLPLDLNSKSWSGISDEIKIYAVSCK